MNHTSLIEEEWSTAALRHIHAAIAAAVSQASSANVSQLTDDLAAALAAMTTKLSDASLPPLPATYQRHAALLDASSADSSAASAGVTGGHDDDDGGCSGLDGVWSPGLHVMAIFVVLAASAIGILFPLLGKWAPAMRLPDFTYAVGKAMAIGVMLGVSLIHMLAESAEQMEAPCIPESFTDMYGSWPFLFAIIAFVLMHFLDVTIQDIASSWAKQRAEETENGATPHPPHPHTQEGYACHYTGDDEAAQRRVEALILQAHHGHAENEPIVSGPSNSSDGAAPLAGEKDIITYPRKPQHATATSADTATTAAAATADRHAMTASHSSGSLSSPQSPGLPVDARALCPVHGEEEHPCAETGVFIHDERESATGGSGSGGDSTYHATSLPPAPADADHILDHAHSHLHEEATHGQDGHGHSHGYIAAPDSMPVIQRVVAAIALEFGVTLHSIIIGLTMGITTDTELRTLVIALVFHQLFEGVAMGSRLADAAFHRGAELSLAMLFVFSAPIGTAIGTAIVSSSRTALSGATFVMTCAVFNAVCAGILLYLTASMLLYDFAADLTAYGGHGKPHRLLKRATLFAAFWIGAGIMSLIGKWL